jgi:myo-inositol 2-dehydrogenase/D-chiro-inositol 1-dehydrogenase
MRRSSPSVAVALLGCGAIASAVHLRLLRRARHVKLVGVADPSEQARERARGIAGVETVSDPLELIARADVDAVVVCARTDQHAELALAAVAGGKHLYLEKPIATSLEDGNRIVEAARSAGVIGMTGFNHRFHPLHVRARRLLAAGAIGQVEAIQTSFCEPVAPGSMPEWKSFRATGGGVLLDLASHQVDLVRWLLGDEIERVEASVSSRLTEDDVAHLRLRTVGGVAVDGFFSLRSGRGDHLRFFGEQGILHLDRYALRLELARTRTDIGAVRRRREPPLWASRPWQLRKLVRPAHEPSYRRSLAAFIEALRGGARELPTLEDGLRSLEVVLAAEASARAGEPVLVTA